MRPRIHMAMGLAALAWQADAAACSAAEVVEVHAADGRVLRGAIDGRTDDTRLWVRQEQDSIVLASSIAWSAVATAALDGHRVEASDLQDRHADLATDGSHLVHQQLSAPIAAAPVSAPRHAIQSRGGRAQVRNVEIVSACLANFDRDIEPDGLAVSIAVIDARGARVAVRGSLSAQLSGERRPASISAVDFGVLDAWSQPVATADFVDGVATYELRFRRTAPEWQFDLLPDAVLDVRLGAFGQGNYAASAPVLVRPFNPLRDNLQLLHETRFMPRELHGRNPASSTAPLNGLWLHWTR